MTFLRAFIAGTVAAVAANLLLLFVLRPLVINPAMPLEILGAGAITIFTIGGAIGATAVYALMRRALAAPDRSFIIVAAVVLLASFIPDYLIIGETTGKFAGANTGSALVLMLMHIAEAVIMVLALTRLWSPRHA